MLERGTTKYSRYLGLGMAVFYGAKLAGVESPWMGIGSFGLGVAAVVVFLYERRVKGMDDPVVLGLHR
jgi:hypothetical protein